MQELALCLIAAVVLWTIVVLPALWLWLSGTISQQEEQAAGQSVQPSDLPTEEQEHTP